MWRLSSRNRAEKTRYRSSLIESSGYYFFFFDFYFYLVYYENVRSFISISFSVRREGDRAWCVICLMSLLFRYDRRHDSIFIYIFECEWWIRTAANAHVIEEGKKRHVWAENANLATRTNHAHTRTITLTHTWTTRAKRNARGRGNQHSVNKKKNVCPIIQWKSKCWINTFSPHARQTCTSLSFSFSRHSLALRASLPFVHRTTCDVLKQILIASIRASNQADFVAVVVVSTI